LLLVMERNHMPITMTKVFVKYSSKHRGGASLRMGEKKTGTTSFAQISHSLTLYYFATYISRHISFIL